MLEKAKYKHIINFPEYDHEDIEFMSTWDEDDLEYVAEEYIEEWFWYEPSDKYLNREYEVSVDGKWFTVYIESTINVLASKKKEINV